ncbi:unnamed protein product [Choristocarpus tenellus]
MTAREEHPFLESKTQSAETSRSGAWGRNRLYARESTGKSTMEKAGDLDIHYYSRCLSQVDVTLADSKVEGLQQHRFAFARHRRLREASLREAHMLQVDLTELLADDILEDMTTMCCQEVEDVLANLAEQLVNEV